MATERKDNTSTLQSYIDSATGAAQNLVGSLTGNTGDQNQGERKKEQAQAEHEASHATAKLPGVTVSSTGAAAKDDPDRTSGGWNQTVGAAKETVGGLVGSAVSTSSTASSAHVSSLVWKPSRLTTRVVQELKEQGRQQNREGQEQEARGQISDFTSGVGNRVQGTVGSVVAGLTNDKTEQQRYQEQHDAGKTRQRGAEHDIQKQAEARQ